MAARSNHPYDIADWISSIIESCETLDQLAAAYKVYGNFRKLHSVPYEVDDVITKCFDRTLIKVNTTIREAGQGSKVN